LSEKQNAQVLIALQEVDLRILRLHKQMDELPQRVKILAVRKKIQEVDTKAEQVERMRTEVNRTIKLLQDEEVLNKEHMLEKQKVLDKTTDYRETTALAQELELLAKRAEKIEFDTLAQMEKLDKVNGVNKQVADARDKLQNEEQLLTVSYQEQGGLIKQEISDAEQTHVELIKTLEPKLATRYEKAAKSKGGIGASQLQGSQCSGCHVSFGEGQMANLKSGPQIGECPNCGRMMVVNSI
jgi:predicted  nucleic acid-binding Zn-ribbon protein